MRRLTIWIASLYLGLAACSQGTTTDDQTTSTEVVAAVDNPTTSTIAITTSSAAGETTVAPAPTDPGRPVAPDFTLELGNGGTYSLSEGVRPVYLVFWAEW